MANLLLPLSHSLLTRVANLRSSAILLLPLSHSLLTRVANLRSSRGDNDGAARARAMAQKLEVLRGLCFWNLAWTMVSNYLRNYSLTGIRSMFFGTFKSSVFSDAKKFLSSLNELFQVESDVERLAWVNRNYENLLKASKSMLDELLRVFHEGAIREVMEMLQREIVEGNLLKDCLEVGTDDLKGLVQIFKDISLKYAASSSGRAKL